MISFIHALIPVIVIVGVGRFMAWRGVIAPEGWRAIERISYVLLFPALIIRELARAPFESAPWGMALALITGQCVLGAIGLLAQKSPRSSGPATGVVIQSNVRWNTFVALSIAGSLFGPEGLALVAVAAAAMIPTANVLSVVALIRFSDKNNAERPHILRDLAKNPLIIACVIGASLNIAGLAPTGVADRTLGLLGQATIALGLLTAGAGVDMAALRRAGARTFLWSIVRLLGLPALAVGTAVLIGISGMQLAIIAICAATPTATNSYILARQLGGDAPLSANLIAVQTVLAAITMPAIFFFLVAISATPILP